VQAKIEHPNFETVWAALQDVAERQRETDRQIKETDRQLKETDRITRENAKLIGKLGNRFGGMIEDMVIPGLVAKFKELGFVFNEAYPHAEINDKENNILTEIDITLKNGDKVMLVEVKSKPTTDDIDEHIERMEKVRAHADRHNDKRTYLGAVAEMAMSESVKTYALNKGFYVIEPSGEDLNLS
jgi:hypothetical protein